MQQKLEKFIIALLDNDITSVQNLIPNFGKKTDIESDYKDLASKNTRISQINLRYPSLMGVACENSNEEIIRILFANDFTFSIGNIKSLIKRDPNNFGKLMDRNPAWFSNDQTIYSDIEYYSLTCDSYELKHTSMDEKTAFFAEFLLSGLMLFNDPKRMIKPKFVNALNIEILSNRIKNSQKKISREIYNSIQSLGDAMSQSDNYNKMMEVITDKYKRQDLKPLGIDTELSKSETTTLELCLKRIQNLEEEVKHLKREKGTDNKRIQDLEEVVKDLNRKLDILSSSEKETDNHKKRSFGNTLFN